MHYLNQTKIVWVALILMGTFQTCFSIEIDPSFTAAKFENYGGRVNAITVQADNKFILVGEFNSWDGISRRNIVRLLANGEVDSSFDAATDSYINDVAIQDDGKILIAGKFLTVNGANQSYLARLNQDGSLDTSFSHAITGELSTVKVDKLGLVLVGGRVWTGGSHSAIRRLNVNGTFDNTFNFTHNIHADSIAVLDDNKILVGGSFANLGNSNVSGIARLNSDGSVDAGFNSNVTNTNSSISVANIGVRSDGKIFIAGYFSDVNGLPRGNVARLNSDGSVDPAFVSSTDSFVNALVVDNQDRAIIGGRFQQVGGISATFALPIIIARLGDNGQPDEGFQMHKQRARTSTFAFQNDGKLIALKSRLSTANLSVSQIVRLSPSGSIDELFLSSGEMTTSIGGTINAIAVQNDGKVIVAGAFARINQQPVKHIARLNIDGSIDNNFNPPSIPETVRGVAIQKDNKILVWSPRHFHRLHPNGSVDEQFNAFINNVSQIAFQNDGKIIVVGFFTKVNGAFRRDITRINSDGTTDESFSVVSMNNAPSTIAIQENGKIVIGGNFDTVNGVTRNRLARLNMDGSLDPTFSPSLDTSAYEINIFRDQSILLSGSFKSANDSSVNGFAKLTSFGQLDESYMNNLDWPSSTLAVTDVAIQCDEKVVALTTLRSPQDRFLRVAQNGSRDTDFVPSMERPDRSIAIQSDGRMIISTKSSVFPSSASIGLARYIDSANKDAKCYQSQESFCLPIKTKNNRIAMICL